MKCPNCNQENPDGAAFCIECGTPLPQEQAPSQPQPLVQEQAPSQPQPLVQEQASNQPQPTVQQTYTQPAQQENSSIDSIPPEYKPISMWGYFGYEILFTIPCIGFILLIVFSLGGTKNVNLKNFARSYFCFIIVAVVLVAVIVLLAVFVGGASLGSMSSSYGYY